MRKIPAAQFKQQCLAILDRVDREGILITKHGRPVAMLQPVSATSSELIGSMKDRIVIHGDLLSTGKSWNAES